MQRIEYIKQQKRLILDRLYEWAETFDIERDEEGERSMQSYNLIYDLAKRFEDNSCTESDFQNILFHLYQIHYNDLTTEKDYEEILFHFYHK